uniref:Group XV phospholipase A2 n=1 Tax=Aegilops tauschii TaxID=37682 RepID=M8C700_AEGTA
MAIVSPSTDLLALLTFLICLLCYCGAEYDVGVYNPIILIPGISCPNLEARLTDAYVTSLPRCNAFKGKGWFSLLNNTLDLVRHDYVSCFEEQMRLIYNPTLKDYQNLPGVETRVPDFGSAHGFTSKNLDASRKGFCMTRVLEELELLGYHDGDNLFGAPYDPRHAPPLPGQPSKVFSNYFARFKDLVERASEKNQDKPVVERVLSTKLRVDAPMVPTRYLNGDGVQMPEQAVYWDGNFDVAPKNVYGDGDGVMNLVSVLSLVNDLRRQQQANIPFKFVKIVNATHSDIVVQEHSLQKIMYEILKANR